MDEAEHCGRLGIMNRGRLLALDTPTALKRDVVPGVAWNVVAEPLLGALEALETAPGLRYTGLLGDHLHAITEPGTHTAESLRACLAEAGFGAAVVEPADITLEDVFIELATRQ
jgi:ABC-2 type transport system ATP-binding protein